MDKSKLKNWAGVVLSAVVLGLAVTYLIRTWQPQDAVRWALWAVSALIAIRSVLRIASLAKIISTKEQSEE